MQLVSAVQLLWSAWVHGCAGAGVGAGGVSKQIGWFHWQLALTAQVPFEENVLQASKHFEQVFPLTIKAASAQFAVGQAVDEVLQTGAEKARVQEPAARVQFRPKAVQLAEAL